MTDQLSREQVDDVQLFQLCTPLNPVMQIVKGNSKINA
jgi:hypothetical protein